MPDSTWWADALDTIGNHDAAEKMRRTMPIDNLAEVVARVRSVIESGDHRVLMGSWTFVPALCDAVERLMAERDAWKKAYEVAAVEKNLFSASTDRLRQLLADLLASCERCGGTNKIKSRLFFDGAEGDVECVSRTDPCPRCGPTRKALEANP